MQITCNVNQTEAIRRGHSTDSTVKLEVNPADLSQEQRDTLASRFSAGAYNNYSHPLNEPTLEGFKESLDACAAAAKKVAAEYEKALQEDWDRFDANPRDTMYFNERYRAAYLCGRLKDAEITNARRAVFDNVQTEMYSEFEQKLAKNKEEEDEKASLRATQAAKRKEAEDNFRDWALQNGSPTLQLRIKEGYSWLPTAVDEYVDCLLVVAGVDASQQVYDTNDDTDVNRAVAPSLSEMQALCDVREALLKVLPAEKFELQLCNVTYTSKEFGEYGEEDDQITRQVELKVCIDTPTGSTLTRFYKV